MDLYNRFLSEALLLYPQQTEKLRFYRMALIPFGLYCSILFVQYDYTPRAAFRPYNFIKNVACPMCIGRTLEYGLIRDSPSWIGYEQAYNGKPGIREPITPGPSATPLQFRDCFGSEGVKYALAMLFSSRGIGWSWGIKGDLVPQARPQKNFLPSLLATISKAHLLLLASMSAVQYAGQGSGKDFLRNLGVPSFPLSEVISRLVLAMVFGTAVWNFLELGYSIIVLLVYAAHKVTESLPGIPAKVRPPPFDTRAWPRLLQNPLFSDSLADWWTYRWHSVLRRTFIVLGFYPALYATNGMGRSFSTMCGIAGAFLVSGMLHEIALHLASGEIPLDRTFPSIRFFVLQGVGLVVEQTFTRLTGRRVNGPLGRLWLLVMLVFPGATLTESWLSRGLYEYQPNPNDWEWWRWLPLVSYIPKLSEIDS